MLEAVLFDLDDTLVLADNEQLMRDYTRRLAKRYAAYVSPEVFSKALIDCTLQAMAKNDAHTTFVERFMDCFCSTLDLQPDLTIFMDFYDHEYAQLGKWARPAPGARQAVEYAQTHGLKIAVATNPLFPYSAIEKRLAWAKLDDIAWNFVTVGDRMHTCKPHVEYFLETALHLGVSPHNCLMVGNDPVNDLPAKRVGMRTFLVEGRLDGENEALRTFSAAKGNTRRLYQPDYRGSLYELPAVIDALSAEDASGSIAGNGQSAPGNTRN
ncbi:MAG: HAD family hydrolase [Limnochordia bacterium]|jgi:FMN phosphatase YigB (HAD superfamily)